jgi:flagellar biosynthesis activator protein FlaF
MTRKTPPLSPHGRAAQNYAAQSQKQASQRETEAQILLRAAKQLQDLQKDWDSLTDKDREAALKYNRQIWVMFYENAKDTAANNNPTAPTVINLAQFVFKRSMDILALPDRDKLNVLITINREVAAGLMASGK